MTENFYPIVLLCDFTKCSTHKSLAVKKPNSIKKSTCLPILRLKIKTDIMPKINKYSASSSPVVLLCDFTKCSKHKSSSALNKHSPNKDNRGNNREVDENARRDIYIEEDKDARKENDKEEEEYIPSSDENTSGDSVRVVKHIDHHKHQKNYKNKDEKSTHKIKSNRKRQRVISSDESTSNDSESDENTSNDSLVNYVNRPKRQKIFKKKLEKYKSKSKINKKRKRNISSDESTSDDYDSDESVIDGYECDESSVDSYESENTSNHSERDDKKSNNRNFNYLNRHKSQKKYKNKLRKDAHKNKDKEVTRKVLSTDESSCIEARSEKNTNDDSASDWSYETREKTQQTDKIKQKKCAHKNNKVLSTDESSCEEVRNEEYTSDDSASDWNYKSRDKRPKTYKIKQKKSVLKNNEKYKHKKEVISTDESNSDNDKSEGSANEDNEKSEEITSDDSQKSEENSNEDSVKSNWIYKIKQKKSKGKNNNKDKDIKKKKLSVFEEMILKKRQEKLELLKSLQINECREAFKESLKPSKQPKKQKEKDDLDISISSRKSLRLMEKDPIVYKEINEREIPQNIGDGKVRKRKRMLQELKELEKELSALQNESKEIESNKSYLRDRKRQCNIKYTEDLLFERSFEQQKCEMDGEIQVLFDEDSS